MSTEQWAAVIALIGAVGTGIGAFFRTITALVRELIQGQTAGTAAQEKTAASVADLRTEIVALRTRVDTVLDVRQADNRSDWDETSSIRSIRSRTSKGI